MTLGRIMLDLRATVLQQDEKELLQHPDVGGVIFFERNYYSVEQIVALVKDIRAIRKPELLIAVDHEGGRIQRFQDGFTKLPPLQLIGQHYDRDKRSGLEIADHAGWLMAAELRAVDIDFSFAPVLDVCRGASQIIGDRSFHQQPQCVAELAVAYMQGAQRAGAASVGKHFPGHGSVAEDSHLMTPFDNRAFNDIEIIDMVPFSYLIDAGIAALMTAHVVYPDIDEQPASFSCVWLNDILRKQLKFRGAVFSDDISMLGAGMMGSYVDRACLALEAGCDMVLVCNNQAAVIEILDNLKMPSGGSQVQSRLMNMYGKNRYDFNNLRNMDIWQTTVQKIAAI